MFASIPEMFLHSSDLYRNKTALKWIENDLVKSYTYKELGDNVKLLFSGLKQMGIKAGDKVAILSENRNEWIISDFAIQSLGGIVVPIYPTLPSNQVEHILKDSETKAIFVENEIQLKKLQEVKKNLKHLKVIISFEKNFKHTTSVQEFSEILKKGEKEENLGDIFREHILKINPNDICSIVYTSGTTGMPKGVMLNHRGFIKDIIDAEAVIGLSKDDIFFSFLPLSHLFERLASHWATIYKGATLFYSRSVDTVAEDIQLAQPTIMVSVPRLYEKIAAAILQKVEDGSSIKKALFNWALNTGKE